MIIPDGWTLLHNALQRTFVMSSYSECVEFTNGVARLAEKQQHHPTITLEYSRVIVQTTTHDQNNTVTDLDLNLAKAINELLA
jgi:4a-hydroxytetrahydrobiopterin dehydratase